MTSTSPIGKLFLLSPKPSISRRRRIGGHPHRQMRKKISKLFASSAAQRASSNNLAGPPPPTKKKLVQAPYIAASSSSNAALKYLEENKKKMLLASVSSQVLRRRKKSASEEKASVTADSDFKEASTEDYTGLIQSILKGNSGMMEPASPKIILGSSWIASESTVFKAHQKKEVVRKRKQKYIFNVTRSHMCTKIIRTCSNSLGPDTTLEFFERLGRDTSIKDYNALIKHCIGKARQGNGEESSTQIYKVYQLFLSMREKGFQIEEASFGPFLECLIDMKMVEEFQIFSELIKDVNPESYYRIGYYEMLLWIRIGDEAKIQELCDLSTAASNEDCFNLTMSYLLAFCDTDRKEELSQQLEVIDITRILSLKYLSSIFKSLGRLQFENFAKKFILALNTSGDGKSNVSSFIFDYASSIPDLEVEEIMSKFSNLHKELGVLPSIVSCDMLIQLCCNLSKVRAAIEVLDLVCRSGLDIPANFFDPLLHACERSCEFDMVHPIYSLMRQHNLKLKETTFKSLISLCVRMKDFEGAYNLLADAKGINGMLTTSMYNAIMAGHFREKNNCRALMVLKQMEDADIKPDSETYCYLIANCECQEDVSKYRDEMRLAGVEKTKHVYMAFINAYAKFGNFELAKQVVLDHEIKSKYLNDIKSSLISALSANGQISDALHVYDEIKQAGGKIEPKAVINLIEHIQSEGELSQLLQLLDELSGSSRWFDGCSRVVLYCVRYNFVNSAIELLMKLKENDKMSSYGVIDKIFGQIWETEPTNLEIGFELLGSIKEVLHLHPSRTCLDFLLSSCVKVKDLHKARLVWSEYEGAGLSYNALTFLRMYQALLASGAVREASKLVKQMPVDDPHVKHIIKSCRATLVMPSTT